MAMMLLAPSAMAPVVPGPSGAPLWSRSVEHLSDEQLIAMSADQPDAFGELVRRHQSFVYGAALRVVKNPSQAEDIAQDAFLRAYKASSGFRGDSAVRTWLYRIATNTALNELEKRREQTLDELPEVAGDSHTENIVELKEASEELRAAIEALPDALRVPLQLREFGHLSYDEISERLNVPLNTVRTRIFRARQALKDPMEEWADA